MKILKEAVVIPTELKQRASIFIWDLFYLNNKKSKSAYASISSEELKPYSWAWGCENSNNDSELKKLATRVYDIIINRTVEPVHNKNIEELSEFIANNYTSDGKYSAEQEAEVVAFYSAENIERCIAIFCSNRDLLFDASRSTPYESRVFAKSKFGKILAEYNCYTEDKYNNDKIIEPEELEKAEPETETSAINSISATNNSDDETDDWSKDTDLYRSDKGYKNHRGTLVSQNPRNKYKFKGPQHSRAMGMVTGQKEAAPSSTVYKIRGKNNNSKTLWSYVFLQPTNSKYINADGTAKVRFGSCNGYEQHPGVFFSYNDAYDFLQELVANSAIPSSIYNVEITRCKADIRGYFRFNTHFGEIFCGTPKFNEDLQEEFEEEEVVAEIELQEEAPQDPIAFGKDSCLYN